MENISSVFGGEEEQRMELPPGFRFHPTDEELISHYLFPKVLDSSFCARAIGQVDFTKCEPWDLPSKAKWGENEWYFFCIKDRKYPTGLRTNRATEAGYWKATGKDKEIYKGKSLVGMKKTLVFYKGRAPKGEKSNWVMHEYRLEGKFSPLNLPTSAKNEWVICRTFQKNSSGKKIPFLGLVNSDSAELCHSGLPSLIDSSPVVFPNVSCFSSSMIIPQETLQNDQFQSPNLGNQTYLSQGYYYPRNQAQNSAYPPQNNQFKGGLQYPVGISHENDALRSLMAENGGSGTKDKQGMMMMKTERVTVSASQDTCLSSEMNPEISSVVSNYEMGKGLFDDHQEGPSTFGGLASTGSFWSWNYL
ncbi:hypothetical protein V2J09_020513 [Rumex salicifolius]